MPQQTLARVDRGWYLLIATAMLAVFIIDIQTMVGVATWLFYLVPLGACILLSTPAAPLIVAAISTVLIVVDFFVSAPGVAAWIAQLNRGFAVLVIWGFAFLTRVVIKSRLTLQHRDWLRVAQASLADRVMGEHSPVEVGQRMLEFVAGYVGAQIGVLYSREGGDRAAVMCGHALPPDRPVRETFDRGEGLVSRVFRSQKAVSIESVPAGQLDVSTALATIRPTALIVSPLMADGRVIGAVELGFLRGLTARDGELLDLLAEPMGIALRTARLRGEREELLLATQRQAEELQTQQEELRVSNEELEQQGNLLRESQARLETQQAELEQTNVQLEEQTQRLERQNDDLNDARRALLAKASELERSNQFKSEFLANMSHELRTPLNSSLILAKLLADNASGNLTDEQIKFANNIYSAGNDLLELINDILDLSKIEARQIELRVEKVPLLGLTENMAQIFRPMAQQKSVAFEIVIDPACPVELQTDSQRLRQILRNLLSNALKFTLQGHVTLSVFVPDPAQHGTHWIAFAVEDTGIGIAQEQQSIIFEPFRQADGTTNRRFGGTGLGLSISRELAGMLGGRIELDSQPGIGSTFTLLLPQVTQVEQAQASPARPLVVSRPVRERAARVAKQPTSIAPPPSGRLLLIVEDDETFANTLASLAANLDFQAMIAATADQGIELALKHRPLAIVLDIHLPDHTGLAVLDRLKHDPATRHIPVQIISGADYTQPALQMGAADVLLKPVEREQLLAALQKLEQRAVSDKRAVLIVEDNTTQRESIQQLLRSEQVQTVAVATAAEAIEQLRAVTFDCMVLDLALPDATGFELLETMAADATCSFPPVIVYTGRTLTAGEEQNLRRYSKSIIIKGARSPERLLDEVTLFLHRVEASLPMEQQRMLRIARSRDSVFEKRTILLVEDDVRNVFAITRVLEPHGAVLVIARNGREALEALERHRDIELVLMDIMMPEMDGLEAMRILRSKPQLAQLPVIALTAKAMPDDRQRCIDAGANDYITKPIDVEKLLSLVRIWLPPRRRGEP